MALGGLAGHRSTVPRNIVYHSASRTSCFFANGVLVNAKFTVTLATEKFDGQTDYSVLLIGTGEILINGLIYSHSQTGWAGILFSDKPAFMGNGNRRQVELDSTGCFEETHILGKSCYPGKFCQGKLLSAFLTKSEAGNSPNTKCSCIVRTHDT